MQDQAKRSDDDVLTLTPTAGDADVAAGLISAAGGQARICRSMASLCSQFEHGAAALVIAAEALDDDTSSQLTDCLSRQPAWSDVPVILLTLSAAESVPAPAASVVEAAGNVTLLERPFKSATFQSAVKMALRSRRRQYQVRDLLVSESEALARAASESERADSRERELRLSEERFRLIANSIPQLAWMARPDGYMFWFNQRWYDFADATLGRTGAELWQAAQDPAAQPAVHERWQRSLATGEPFDMEFALRGRQGTRWFLTRAVALTADNGRPKLWFGTSTDITEQRATAQALRQSEARLLLAVQTARLGLWTFDVREQRFDASEHFLSMIGRGGESPIDARLWSAVHPDDQPRVRAAVERAIAHAEPLEVEFRTAAIDGVERWLIARARPILGDDGAVAQLLGVALDTTEAKLAEQRRELALSAERAARTQAERVGRMKDEFLATLSHELRTPLNAVLGWAEVLQRAGAGSPDFERGITAIARNAKVQAQLIEDLLDMSRIVSGGLKLDTEEVDLNDVAQAAVDSMAPAAVARSVVLQRIAGAPAIVRGDRRRLQQVVWNLLSNAVKFTPPNGRVTVAIECDDERAKIIVADTGQGIDRDFLPYLFERFRQEDSSRTRRQGGLGIGLSIVRQLVQLHFGEVTGISEGPGRGSTFTVALPLLEVRSERRAVGEDTASANFSSLRNARILAVDDERDARELIARILSEHGAHVILADSAAQAIEVVQRERVQLIISDIGMPGTDGYELMQSIRQLPSTRGGNVPALALTAFARLEDREMALRCGFQRHLVKPLNSVELLSTCATLVAQRLPMSPCRGLAQRKPVDVG